MAYYDRPRSSLFSVVYCILAEAEDECGETSGEDCDDAEEGGTAIGVAIKDLWVEWVYCCFFVVISSVPEFSLSSACLVDEEIHNPKARAKTA